MIVLVTGSRDWGDVRFLHSSLDRLHAVMRITRLVQGEATGADEISALWAIDRGVELATRTPWIPIEKTRYSKFQSAAINRGEERGYPALWHQYDSKAGPIRNTEMLKKESPNFALAFTQDLTKSKGTRNMVFQLVKAKIPYVVLGEGA